MVFGDYKCKAWNELGKLEKVITLQQGVQPEPPDHVQLKGAHVHSLDLEIRGPDMTNKTIVRDMEPTGYRVQIKEVEEHIEWERASTVDFPIRDGLYFVFYCLN